MTVTHPEVSRYFLSLEEAVELLILAVSLDGVHGVFIPDPGEPVRILDLARQLIQEAGSERETQIPIVITRLRPGDKMSEEFLGPGESVVDQQNAKLRRIHTPQPSPEQFDAAMDALTRNAARRDLSGVLAVLCELVPEYRPSNIVLELREAPQSSSR
jgi:FlaA1/EpsC-like NDP-sugar epimerase